MAEQTKLFTATTMPVEFKSDPAKTEIPKMTMEQAAKHAAAHEPFCKSYAESLLKKGKKVFYIHSIRGLQVEEVTKETIHLFPNKNLLDLEDHKYIDEPTFESYQTQIRQ